MNIYTGTLSIDEYNNPQVLKGKKAIELLLIQLMLLNPGTSQTHPLMGVGLVKNWRYMYMENLPSLQMEITKQIATYLPTLQGVIVTVEQDSTENKRVNIYITIEDTLYAFATNEKGTLSTI